MVRLLGKKPRSHNNILHFSQMKRAVCRPPIPDQVNWLHGMPTDLGMMLNDQLGCCTMSGLHHGRQVWSYNSTGVLITDADIDVKTDYINLCGYVDGDPSTDQGANMQDCLSKMMKLGISTDNGKDFPVGYVEIDPRLQHDVREVIAMGGFFYAGMNIPESWTEMDGGGNWADWSGQIAGGHCVIMAGYDADSFYVISWGSMYRLTNAAFAATVDEGYWIVDKDWVEKTGKTPGGIDLQTVENYQAAIAA